MRVALDTNVLVAGFVARGVCHDLIEHVVGRHQPVVSAYVLDEYSRTLVRKLGVESRQVEMALELIQRRFEIVEPEPLGERVATDPDDDPVLALLLHAECLVTGDRELLSLQSFRGRRIVRPGDFWAFERQGGQSA